MSLFNFASNVIIEDNHVVITNFPTKLFLGDCYKNYHTSKFAGILSIFGIFNNKIRIHNFLLPELVFLLHKFDRSRYSKIIQVLYDKTWLRNTTLLYSTRIDSTSFKDLNYKLKSYQKNFIYDYDQRKQRYNLNGMILGFEQGLGKTFTSLALMNSLDKDNVFIIAPKSTLRTVWEKEINNVFNKKQDIWVVGDPPKVAKFYIVNYESILKLEDILQFINPSHSTGLIVDEIHNFRNVNTQRVENLKRILAKKKCDDILLMSGTPIKALGSEMIPSLQLLDNYFDDEALTIFSKAFGLNTEYAIDILRNRLGLMMYRKTKKEVLSLPEKKYYDIKIKTPSGNIYTEENVKTAILEFINDRRKFHSKNLEIYQKSFDNVIYFLSKTERLKNNKDFNKYLEFITFLKKNNYSRFNKDLIKNIAWANKYEKEVLRPLLTPELKKQFDYSKSAIKYIDLKIRGEVLSGFLGKLRSDMTIEMIKHSPICSIIKNAEKKTICFTTSVKVSLEAMKYIKNNCHMEPILVNGSTSKNIVDISHKFKTETPINPLIATIQTLSTGVTLTEANTIIFLNKPWRYVDVVQAEDRIHRIGQDTDVEIYNFVLDTGNKNNLSTRMNDIVQWSQDLFEGIIGPD